MRSKHKSKRWMTIKINLEKAYDYVRWDFIEASLQAAGSFSLKSAYGKLQERTWNLKEPICQLLLKFKGPQRVGFFPWLILKQHLLTNAERARRGVGIDNACQVCKHGSEDVLHVLRDCLTGYSWNIGEIIKISYSWVKQYDSVPKSPVYRTRSIASNPHLERNWVRLTTDGSVRMNVSFAAARGYVCHYNGVWIFYYNRYLGMCMVLDAELWGILDGLHLILERGYGSILIETDNLKMVNAI
ncbi:uncharacterized protein LOC105801034 [Gossypium raimondii]|uniref:uncharacterized protein LOC105801034 n=1 Tax=Gossypium raimondii TaxID=29730 RepID=UPI00063A9102|nr:uncharacterized protein LOC105801034 [Gossypium raimondii]